MCQADWFFFCFSYLKSSIFFVIVVASFNVFLSRIGKLLSCTYFSCFLHTFSTMWIPHNVRQRSSPVTQNETKIANTAYENWHTCSQSVHGFIVHLFSLLFYTFHMLSPVRFSPATWFFRFAFFFSHISPVLVQEKFIWNQSSWNSPDEEKWAKIWCVICLK